MIKNNYLIDIVYHYNQYSQLENVENIANKLNIITKSNSNIRFNLVLVGIKKNLNQLLVKKINRITSTYKSEFNSFVKVVDNKYENNLSQIYKLGSKILDNSSSKTLFINGNPATLIDIIAYTFTTPSDFISFKLVDGLTKLVKYDGYSISNNIDKGYYNINIVGYDEFYDKSKVDNSLTIFSNFFNSNLFAVRSDLLNFLFKSESQFFFDIETSINIIKHNLDCRHITGVGFEMDRIELHSSYMYDRASVYAKEFDNINKLIRENIDLISCREPIQKYSEKEELLIV